MQQKMRVSFLGVCACVWIDQKTMMPSVGKRGDVTHPLLDFAEKGSFFLFFFYISWRGSPYNLTSVIDGSCLAILASSYVRAEKAENDSFLDWKEPVVRSGDS